MDKLGEMYRSQGVGVCKRSGYCCKLSPCKWGVEKGAEKNKPCKFLGGEIPGQHFCTLYDWIIVQENYDRMFTSGCRLANNPDRKGL